MVTETQYHTEENYANMNSWLKFGLTTLAGVVCEHKWSMVNKTIFPGKPPVDKLNKW